MGSSRNSAAKSRGHPKRQPQPARKKRDRSDMLWVGVLETDNALLLTITKSRRYDRAQDVREREVHAAAPSL